MSAATTAPTKRKRGRPAVAKCQLCAKPRMKGDPNDLCARHRELLDEIVAADRKGRRKAGRLPVQEVKPKKKPRGHSRRTVPKAARRRAA